MFSSRAVVLSFGAFAVSLAAGYYMKSMFLPFAKTLRRQKSQSDLRFGSFDTFEDWLRSKTFLSGLAQLDPQLEQIILQLLSAIEEIAHENAHIGMGTSNLANSSNSFGDNQLKIDLIANEIMFNKLQGYVAVASSEETPEELPMGGSRYAVAFDPLDGSSIVDTNFTVGTIVGVWESETFMGVTGRTQVCALMALYGPRTSLTIALHSRPGAYEFTLGPPSGWDGRRRWLLTNAFFEVREGILYSPGNLRCTQDNEGYRKLHDYWVRHKYTLRYSGGMVPDVNQILVKGQGVFVNAASPAAPAKLRLLYEVAPIAYIVEKAGGRSSDGSGTSLLDLAVQSTQDRTQVALGSAVEVARFDSIVGPAQPAPARP